MPPIEKPWFRMYASILTDHKVQSLKGDALGWLNLLAVASVRKPRGTLPDRQECAFQLRMSQPTANKLIERLMAAKLVDEGPEGLRIHNWGDWQKERDVTPSKRDDNHANGDDGHANVTDTVRKITLDQSRAEQKRKEQSRAEQNAPADADPAPTGEDIPAKETTDPSEKPKRSRHHSLAEAEEQIPRFREEHPTLDVPRAWQMFTNNLKSKSKTFTDYIAAFENWLLNEEIYARQRLQTAGRSSGGRQRGAIAGPDLDGWDRFAAGEN